MLLPLLLLLLLLLLLPVLLLVLDPLLFQMLQPPSCSLSCIQSSLIWIRVQAYSRT